MLVRIPAKRWVIPVRISPAQVGHPRENTCVMVVGNDTFMSIVFLLFLA